MNVQSLLDQAIYESLQDQEHQPIINTGYEKYALTVLNFLLDEWRDKIPFAQELTFTNVDDLTNSSFVSVSNVNFVLNQVQMPLTPVSLSQFNAIQSPLNLKGIPQVYYFDELAQSILVFPAPTTIPAYSFTVWGRLADQPLSLFDQIPANVPLFMTNALIFELAFRLCAHFGVPWTEEKDRTRQSLLMLMNRKRDIDLSPLPTCEMGRPQSGGVPPYPWLWAISGGGQ